MSSVRAIDLFVEDRAHEELLSAEEGVDVTVRTRSGRGGRGRALTELALYQRVVKEGLAGPTQPDLIIVGIDANCARFAKKQHEIRSRVESVFEYRTLIATPDPHVERWYLADPDSFQEVVGVFPSVGRKKCERDRYKRILAKAIKDAGHPPTLGGVEFARELVAGMDLYRAGKNEASFEEPSWNPGTK